MTCLQLRFIQDMLLGVFPCNINLTEYFTFSEVYSLFKQFLPEEFNLTLKTKRKTKTKKRRKYRPL